MAKFAVGQRVRVKNTGCTFDGTVCTVVEAPCTGVNQYGHTFQELYPVDLDDDTSDGEWAGGKQTFIAFPPENLEPIDGDADARKVVSWDDVPWSPTKNKELS